MEHLPFFANFLQFHLIVELSSGALDSWQFCHNKAKDLCPTGYEVLSSNESQKDYSLLRLDPGLWVGTAEVNPYLNRRMFVACK